MANFLDNFTKKSDNIYITLSTAGGLEMICKDPQTGAVKAYAQTPLEYNEAQREIAKFDDFKTSVNRLIQICDTQIKGAQVYLSLPLVWFGYKDNLPLLLDDNAITNTVLGELEQTYIFKKRDPAPVWFDAIDLSKAHGETRSVFYTALQKDIVDRLETTFSDLGATLVKIGCSLFEDLKGLNRAGYISEEVADETKKWHLMIINNSGFQMYTLTGYRIIESYEEPLPIKSYEGEEIYSAIGNAAQISLMATDAQTLVILSEADLVSAKILAGKIQFNGKVKPIDDNKYKEEPLMELSLNIVPENKIKVTIGMIGITAVENDGFTKINFLNKIEEVEEIDPTVEIPIGNGQIIQLTPEKATILAGIIMFATAILIGGIYLIAYTLKNNVQEETNRYNQQISELDSQIKALTSQEDLKTGFNPIKTIEEVLKVNRTKIIAYDALGDSIPKDVYLTYFVIGDAGTINIKGCAKTVEDVYIFFRNLKDSMTGSSLRLSKLDLRSGSLDALINNSVSQFDDAPYAFEITNMDNNQLSLFGLIPNTNSDKKEKSKRAQNDGQGQGEPQGQENPPAEQGNPPPEQGNQPPEQGQ